MRKIPAIKEFFDAVWNSFSTRLPSGFRPQNTLPLIVFVLVLSSGLFLLGQNHAIDQNEESMVIQQILVTQESELSRRLSYTLSSTYILAQEVARSRGEFERFDTFANSILQRMEGVSNLQLAPNGIITRIYPLTGNERAIGHNILRDDKRKDEALEAIQDRRLTLAGPFELVQGGTAVIGRNPVFLPGPEGREEFWGFTSALILLEDLIGGAGLNALSSIKYAYELSRISPETGKKVVFASNGDSKSIKMQSIDILVPNGSWTLSIGSLNHNTNTIYRIEQLAAFVVALLIAAFTRRIANEPENLRQKVVTQTQALHRLAYFDALTGLPNRHHFNHSLHDGLKKSDADGSGLALLLMDLDHFKEVNDTLGHDIGDLLLCQASDRLSQQLPSDALLARLGGDEFTVIVMGSNYESTAEQLSRDIVKSIGKPFDLQGNVVHVSASIGIASSSCPQCKAGDLLKCADQAMYKVKRNGRGGFRHFSESFQQEIALRASLAKDLHTALQKGELYLLYQPIIENVSGKVELAEALLRWNHPTQGIMTPPALIPLAEEAGLTYELGEWALGETIRQLQYWRRNYSAHFQISVDVSPMQFLADGLVPRWVAAAKAISLTPDSVIIKITEGVLLDNSSSNIKLLSALKNAGIQIALDDFGTCYSSLRNLKMLNIDFLRIDGSFTQNVTTDSTDMELCKAVLSIARSMGHRVIAEGVVTNEQATLLRSIGCHYLQGDLYSKPVTPREFEKKFFGSAPGKSKAKQIA